MTLVASTPYWHIEVEPQHPIVRMRRTATPLTDVSELDRYRDTLRDALEPFDPARYGLLVDLRDGPLRSDPEFEARSRASREAALKRFTRVAVLVATAVGRLQLTRHAREEGRGTPVFMDEAEALRWFTATPAASARPIG